MSTVNHNALLATGWQDDDRAALATFIDRRCAEADGATTENNSPWRSLFTFTDSIINRTWTLVMAPDGSNEYWDTSDIGDQLRGEVIGLIRAINEHHGGDYITYVEIGYGEFGQAVLRGNNSNHYDDRVYAGDPTSVVMFPVADLAELFPARP